MTLSGLSARPRPAIGHRANSSRTLLALVAIGAVAVAAGGFVSLAPNRLVSGRPVALWDAAGVPATMAIAVLGLALAVLALTPPRRPATLGTWHRAAAAIAAGLVVAVLLAAGSAARHLAAGAPSLARVSLGAGFWVLLAAAALAVLDGLQRAGAGNLARFLVAAAIVAAVATMAGRGWFNALGLAHEYRSHRAVFAGTVGRHLVLVVGSVVPAVVIGVSLGILAHRRERWRGAIFAGLNLLQTIPSIALFGLLIAPLSALATAFPALARLGVGGIGPAPAIVALILYALLPVARNTASGLAGIDPATVEAARGMGMTRRQIFRRVEVPLALPVLLAGLRIVTVQTIGLVVVAALIGAGGLGDFVFAGLGQDAAGLVLLGALPTIFLALVADFLLKAAATAALRR